MQFHQKENMGQGERGTRVFFCDEVSLSGLGTMNICPYQTAYQIKSTNEMIKHTYSDEEM